MVRQNDAAEVNVSPKVRVGTAHHIGDRDRE